MMFVLSQTSVQIVSDVKCVILLYEVNHTGVLGPGSAVSDALIFCHEATLTKKFPKPVAHINQ